MKKTLTYIAAALLGVTALSSCDDDFTRPPLVLPETLSIEPTMTTEAFKAQYWSTVQSGPAAIGMTESGDSIIITGRVCSSDQSGNIYKNVVVQSHDAEGNQIALSFSVNRNDIYELFPFGQEVAIYATGLNIGPYRKLLQFGSVNGDQMTFMDEAVFTAHVFRNKNAFPEPVKVDTTVASLKEIVAAKSNDKDLMMWQSRLVRVDGVSFQDAGQQFAGKQTADRYVTDAEGNRLNVRNSSYSDFSDAILPYGTGSVVGILSYYQSDWQLLLIDKAGCIGFDGVAPEPGPGTTPSGEGTAESPYNVVKALEVINGLGADVESGEVYVAGVITAIKEVSPDFGNATYSITDEGGNQVLGVYRGYWLNGDKFTSADQLKTGAKVVVKGKLINFKGNTPQFTTGNQLVSYNGETGGGDEPVTPPAPGEEIKYSLVNEVSSGASYVLVVDGQYGAAIASTSSYGRFNLTDASISDNSFTGPSEAAFVLKMVDGKGYTMTDHSGRYLSMDDSHFTTFQIFDTPQDGSYWTIEFADGKVKITNALNTNCFVCVSKGNEGTYYTNMAPAKEPAEYKLPQLFKAE